VIRCVFPCTVERQPLARHVFTLESSEHLATALRRLAVIVERRSSIGCMIYQALKSCRKKSKMH